MEVNFQFFYLKNRLWVLDFYKVIADDAFGLIKYFLIYHQISPYKNRGNNLIVFISRILNEKIASNKHSDYLCRLNCQLNISSCVRALVSLF